MQDIRTKSHDLFSNVIPALSNINQMQNQEFKSREHENIKFTERLDKIIDLIETSKEPAMNENTFMMQILKAIKSCYALFAFSCITHDEQSFPSPTLDIYSFIPISL